jgi:hypothetical protein
VPQCASITDMSPVDPIVQLVDERDSNWEIGLPVFRVYIQSESDAKTSSSTATYDLVGVDVEDAIGWARSRAGENKTFAVALVYDDQHRDRESPGHGRGLIWLLGRDANSSG